MRGRAWTAEEDAILRRYYARRGGPARALARLRGRTLRALHQRAWLILPRRRCCAWTPEEIRTLRLYWHEVGMRTLRSHLPGRTRAAILWKVDQLGLGRGVPQGLLGVTAAARRAGVELKTLDKILAAAGVERRRVESQRDSLRGWWAVDRDAVDRAVRHWLSTEEVQHAALARGLAAQTLRAWLRAAGALDPPVPGRRVRWRVPTAVIDRVIAEHRPRYRNRPRKVA